MWERHDRGSCSFCGNRLRVVSVLSDRLLALAGCYAAALHRAGRDRRIGWRSLQLRQRPFLVAD